MGLRKIACKALIFLCLFLGAGGISLTAQTPGERVIAAAKHITGMNAEQVNGDCWDFTNVVFYRAGFPPSAREQVFSSKKSGPYADRKLLQPGDWLYLTFSGDSWEHSVIFISWINAQEGLALVAEYNGSFRLESGFLGERSISDIWTIIRAKEAGSWKSLDFQD